MKIINTALLSYGMSGKVFHAPFVDLHPGFSLAGSWERSKKEIEKDYPGVRSYPTMEDVLNDPKVELIVVNTPTYTHFDYVKKSLEAGKHVVVEKAFTTTTSEAKELNRLAKTKGLKLCVYQNRRWDSDFKTVQSIMKSGKPGKIVEATFGFLRYAPELSPKGHKENPGPGAGILKDLGPHIIDQALTLFGVPDSVFGDIMITRPGSEVDDYFNIILKYNSHRVILKGGYFYKDPGPSYILQGTKGTFMKPRGDVQEDQLKAGMKPNDPAYGKEPESEKGVLTCDGSRESIDTLPGDYKEYYEGVYQCLVHNAPEPVSATDGINVMRIIDASIKSYNEGIVVPV